MKFSILITIPYPHSYTDSKNKKHYFISDKAILYTRNNRHTMVLLILGILLKNRLYGIVGYKNSHYPWYTSYMIANGWVQ